MKKTGKSDRDWSAVDNCNNPANSLIHVVRRAGILWIIG